MAIEDLLVSRSTEMNPDELGENTAAQLLYLSFRFSQGSPFLQKKLFEFAVCQYPHWKPCEFPDRVTDIASHRAWLLIKKKIRHTLNAQSGGALDAEAVRSQMDLRRKDFDRVLSNVEFKRELENLKHLVSTITASIVKSDYSQLCEKDFVRPRNFADHRHLSPKDDPNGSHICDYALRGEETGLGIYNDLFQRVRTCLFDLMHPSGDYPKMDNFTLLRLGRVIEVYRKRHEGVEIDFPWEYKHENAHA